MTLIEFKRSKMSEEEKNMLKEFEGISYNNSGIDGIANCLVSSTGGKNTFSPFATTIITVNNEFCSNRETRLLIKCSSIKTSAIASFSPHKYLPVNM